MDSCEFLALLRGFPLDEVYPSLNEYYKSEKAKCTFLTHVFCQCLVDCNLWVVTKVHELVSDIEKETVKKKNEQSVMKFMHLIKRLKATKYALDAAAYKDVTKADIDAISFTKLVETPKHNASEKYKEVLTPEAYDILVMLQTCLERKDASDAIRIAMFLLWNKQSFLFQKPGHDIIWILFDFLLEVRYEPTSRQNIRDFIGMMRDLFFYKSRAKTRLERFPCFIACMVVALKGGPRVKALDIGPLNDRMAYLYVLTEYDNAAAYEVGKDKTRVSEQKRPHKRFNIKDKDFERQQHMKQTMAIIKSK